MIEYEAAALTEENLAQAAAFLASSESLCVTLMGYFVRDGRLRLPLNPSFFTLVYKKSVSRRSLCAVVMCDSSGFILYHVDASEVFTIHTSGCEESSGEVSRFLACAAVFFRHRRFDCLMGHEEGYEILKNAIPARPKQVRRYVLCDGSSVSASAANSVPIESGSAGSGMDGLPKGLSVRRCGPDDTALLLPLQEAYEIEEVLPVGAVQPRSVCEAHLRNLLRTQRIFAVFDGENPVAKAGTNAIGLAWDQVGGVYTLPAWRNRGIARFLTRYLAQDIRRYGKNAVLFVRVDNEAARASYRRAGYVEKSGFYICYF